MSENNTVCIICNMGRYSSYSIMGANIKPFNDKYCIDEINVYATWNCMYENYEDVIRVYANKSQQPMHVVCVKGCMSTLVNYSTL